jgi:hypothetical protein
MRQQQAAELQQRVVELQQAAELQQAVVAL